MATIKVHGITISTATQRVFACLYEKELEFEFVRVDMRSDNHKKEPYLSLNPFGLVPAFEDGDLKLFESRAITRYIAEAYADKGYRLIDQEDKKKAALMSVWMEAEAHHYDGPASALNWELCIKPHLGMTTDVEEVEENEAKLEKVLDIYEKRLGQSKYIGGDCFSLADLNHLPTVECLTGTRSKKLFVARPNVNAWCEAILARPAWQKAIAMKNNNQ